MSDYLIHHGILGQKWGVRRYQNEDGTLTDAGRKRYLELDKKYAELKAKTTTPLFGDYSKKTVKKRNKAGQKLNAFSNKLGLGQMTDEESENFAKIIQDIHDSSEPDYNFGLRTTVSKLDKRNLENMTEAVKKSAASRLTSSVPREEAEAFTRSFLRAAASTLSFESAEIGSNVWFGLDRDGNIIAIDEGIK